MARPDPIPFDSHRFVKRLTGEGMPAGQAEALADEQISLLNSNLVTKQDISHLATKEDVAKCATKEDVAKCATKEEVAATNEAVARCATKEEVAKLATKEEVAKLATKEEVAKLATKEEVAKLATKEEVAKLATKEEVAVTNERLAKLERRVNDVAEDVAVLKSDLRTLKWVVVGVGFGMLTMLVGMSSLMIKILGTV